MKRAFNWADAEGILTPNPLKHVKKGPPKRRERALTADERQQILKAARGRAFRDFEQALQETGCRPSEVGKVEAANVDLAAGLWVLGEHKTKKTGKPRLVYLTPAMLELTRKLMERYPIFAYWPARGSTQQSARGPADRSRTGRSNDKRKIYQ